MGDAIGSTLGYAVGIAISPIPIAAVILMLFSDRARSNSLSFLAAWLIGIGIVATVVVMMPVFENDDSAPSSTTGWLKLALGLLLLVGAVRQWSSRPGPEDDPPPPGWMARIDDLSPAAAFGLGLLVSAPRVQALFVASTSTIFLRTRVLPNLLGYVRSLTALVLFRVPIVSNPTGIAIPVFVVVVSATVLLARLATSGSPLNGERA